MVQCFIASYDAQTEKFGFNNGVQDVFFPTKREAKVAAKSARITAAKKLARFLREKVAEIKKKGGNEKEMAFFVKDYLSNPYKGNKEFLSLLSPYLYEDEADALALLIKRLRPLTNGLRISFDFNISGTFYADRKRRTRKNIEFWKAETERTAQLGFRIISEFSLLQKEDDADLFFSVFEVI